jgi:hypothetical protein
MKIVKTHDGSLEAHSLNTESLYELSTYRNYSKKVVSVLTKYDSIKIENGFISKVIEDLVCGKNSQIVYVHDKCKRLTENSLKECHSKALQAVRELKPEAGM